MQSPKIQNIISDYIKGRSILKIIAEHHVSHKTIRKILNQSKTPIRTKEESYAKYSFNHDFFKNIDTENSAYFLGLLMADGSICNKCVNISIKSVDEHILHAFINSIEGNNVIHKYTTKTSYGWCTSSRLCLRSDRMIRDLALLGVTKRKTYNIEVPKIQNHLEKHFWRGFFDGDGHISTYSQTQQYITKKGLSRSIIHKLETGLCGHINTINAFVEFLARNGIKPQKIRADHSIFNIKIHNKESVKFLDLIYAGSNPKLCLVRKFNKYLEWQKSHTAVTLDPTFNPEKE